MSNDSSPMGGGHGFDSDALEQWVTETARQKGVSKQRLLDEILSSYWVLEELSEVVSNPDGSNDSTGEDHQPIESHQPTGRVDPTPEPQPQPTDRSTDSQPDSQPESSTGVEFSDLKSELQEIRSAVDELSTPGPDADPSEPDQRPETEFSFLEDQLQDFSSAVVDHQTETESTVEEISERLDTVDERLSEIESDLNSGMPIAELREAVGENKSAHAELESRIESEFDSIEQVLQHLLDTTDNIEHRLGAVSDSRQEALRPLQQRNAMQDQLADLKQEAIRHGVKSCNCDSCGQSIDLGLLERPECPSCERRATGISKGGWLSLSKPTLKTTDRDHPPANNSTPAHGSWQSTDQQQTTHTQQPDW